MSYKKIFFGFIAFVFFLLIINVYASNKPKLIINDIEIKTCEDLGGIGSIYGCYKSCINKVEIEEGNKLCSDLTKEQLGKCCGNALLEEYICNSGQQIGDVNNDKKINKKDAKMVLNIKTGNVSMPENICCADFNKDDKIDSKDAQNILLVEKGVKESPGICGCRFNKDCNDYNEITIDVCESPSSKDSKCVYEQLLKQCNDLVCAKIENDDLTQFKTYTIHITSNREDLDSISEVVKKDEAIIDRVDTSVMTCQPKNCDKFPLMLMNEGKYNVNIVAKRGNIGKTINFNVSVSKSPHKSAYRSFSDSELKRYKFLIAINDDYYNKKSPEFIKRKSVELLDYINSIFSKNTKIRFELAGTIKYDDKTLSSIVDMDEITKGYNADKVLFIWLNDDFDDLDRPVYFRSAGNAFGNKYFSYVGQERYNIFDTPLDSQTQQDYGTVLHEMGHTFSLGFPEQYFFEYYDCNPDKPQLNPFIYLFEDPYEPMNKGIQEIAKDDNMFSDYNAAKLNNLADVSVDDIGRNAYIKIVDGKGLPLANVNVTMYCLRIPGVFSTATSCKIDDKFHFNKEHRDSRYSYTFGDSIPINKLTQSDGMVRIPFLDYTGTGFTTGCIAYSIKAKKDGKAIGVYVNLMDSRFEKFTNNKDKYIRVLELR